MINRKDADAARATLDISWPLEDLTEAAITGAFKAMARICHPDHGGTAGAFVQVQEAKVALLAWLAQRPEAKEALAPDVCPRCEGAGYTQMRAGFSARGLRKQCPRCKGTGDISYDTDRSSD